MSGSITLTAAMRANLLSLQQTGTQLSTTQLALATGNKVNSALDNPVNYFAAQSLNTRASSLSALLDGMGQSIQTIQAANQGLTSITGLVQQLTSIANSATQDLATQTTQNVLATAGASGLSSATVNNIVGAGIVVGDTLNLTSVGGAAESFTATAAETLSTLVSRINATSAFTAKVVYGDGVTTSPNGGAVEAVGSAYLLITATDGTVVNATNDAHNTGTGFLATLGLPAASSAASIGGAAADVTNYGNVLGQINALAADSNYQGSNLINGGSPGTNLTVLTDELSGSITVSSVSANATGLGLAALTGTTAGIATATAQIKAALSTLQTQASGFSNSLSMIQNRQDFATNLVNTLQNGASALTIADKNTEGAQLLALQTQQQLGIEALSLSSQANQSVLRLFA